MDTLIQELQEKKQINCKGCVEEMRRRRKDMVQTLVSNSFQYVNTRHKTFL